MDKEAIISEKAAMKSRAENYLSRRQWAKALGEFEKIVQLDPMDFRAHLKVGDLLQKLGKSRQAVAQYKQLAHDYIDEGLLIQAVSITKIIHRIDPSQEDIQRELDGLCAQIGSSSPIPEDRLLVRKRLREIPLFSELNPDELHDMIDHLTLSRVAKGDFVCREGDPGDSIYFISSGAVEILRYTKKTQRDIFLAKLSEGDFFGEFAFFSDQKRHASVRALTDLEILEISRDDFDEIAKIHPRTRSILLDFYKKRVIDTLLALSPLFGKIPPPHRAQLVSRFKLRRVKKNSLIFKQGAPPTSFFVIKSGEVEVFTSKKGQPTLALGCLRPGDFFGEISLILNRPRTASVRTTKTSGLLELKKADFDYIVGTYSPLKVALETISRKRLESTRRAISSHWTHKPTVGMV